MRYVPVYESEWLSVEDTDDSTSFAIEFEIRSANGIAFQNHARFESPSAVSITSAPYALLHKSFVDSFCTPPVFFDQLTAKELFPAANGIVHKNSALSLNRLSYVLPSSVSDKAGLRLQKGIAIELVTLHESVRSRTEKSPDAKVDCCDDKNVSGSEYETECETFFFCENMTVHDASYRFESNVIEPLAFCVSDQSDCVDSEEALAVSGTASDRKERDMALPEEDDEDTGLVRKNEEADIMPKSGFCVRTV